MDQPFLSTHTGNERPISPRSRGAVNHSLQHIGKEYFKASCTSVIHILLYLVVCRIFQQITITKRFIHKKFDKRPQKLLAQ